MFCGGVAGDCEEHVVEVWAVDRQVFDVNARVVKLVEQIAQRGDAAVAGDLQDQLIVVRVAFGIMAAAARGASGSANWSWMCPRGMRRFSSAGVPSATIRRVRVVGVWR